MSRARRVCVAYSARNRCQCMTVKACIGQNNHDTYEFHYSSHGMSVYSSNQELFTLVIEMMNGTENAARQCADIWPATRSTFTLLLLKVTRSTF